MARRSPAAPAAGVGDGDLATAALLSSPLQSSQAAVRSSASEDKVHGLALLLKYI